MQWSFAVRNVYAGIVQDCEMLTKLVTFAGRKLFQLAVVIPNLLTAYHTFVRQRSPQGSQEESARLQSRGINLQSFVVIDAVVAVVVLVIWLP